MASGSPTGAEHDAGRPGAGSRGGRPRDPQLDTAILEATRRQLVLRGYSQLTIADVAADAGVSRPTIYRRWNDKLQLVSDALDGAAAAQERDEPEGDDAVARSARETLGEAVRRVDPGREDPAGVLLQADFLAESDREPELLEMLAARAVEPRVRRLEDVLHRLREQGDVRADFDVHTLATLCFGGFFGARLRGERDHDGLAAAVADTVWELVRTRPADPGDGARPGS